MRSKCPTTKNKTKKQQAEEWKAIALVFSEDEKLTSRFKRSLFKDVVKLPWGAFR